MNVRKRDMDEDGERRNEKERKNEEVGMRNEDKRNSKYKNE